MSANLAFLFLCIDDDIKQEVPIDSHVLKIFRSLGWVPNETGQDCPFVCQASTEGWFPVDKWGELNQVHAGLGQFMRDKTKGQAFLDFAWEKCENDEKHPVSLEDCTRLRHVARLHSLVS
jgi:endonuclease III